MSAPQIGSRWLDTRAKNPTPHAIGDRRSHAKPGEAVPGEWRRIVKVVGVGTRFAGIDGIWQQKTNGTWETMAVRRTSADVSTFCRRYQPLEES